MDCVHALSFSGLFMVIVATPFSNVTKTSSLVVLFDMFSLCILYNQLFGDDL